MSFRNSRWRLGLLASTWLALLVACGEDAVQAKPEPIALTRQDTGYFCGMIVADHTGPKSQIILRGDISRPLWFTTARDGVAFQRLPEESRPIHAFYVSAVDLGGWEHPELDLSHMIEAGVAWFVIGSEKLGSMGAPETIPFADRDAARAFAEDFGGEVLRLQDIPDHYILGPASNPSPAPM